MSKLSEQDLKYIAAYDDEIEDFEPEFPECSSPPKDCPNDNLWWPSLNKPQMEMFNDYSRNLLLHGPRFGAKSYGVAHKIVRHAWETWDALALVTTYSLEGLTSGLLEDLVNEVLPDWTNNIGLEWNGPKQNVSKTTYIKVANKFGGWSTIMFKPCPSVNIISKRFKPIKASLIVFEEMGDENEKKFYTQLNQQLRRNYVKNYQFIAVTNPPPEGPKHYLYDMFFVEPEDEEEAKKWSEKYKHIYFDSMLNEWRDVEGYLDNIRFDNRDDPNAVDRLVKGEWKEVQLGDGIFKDYFLPNIHVKGDISKNRRLLAQPNMPIILGADQGDTNNGFAMQQQVHLQDKVVWMQLDELETVGRKIPLPNMIHFVYEKMNDLVKRSALAKGMGIAEAVQAFRFEFIADSSTMRFRQSGGDVERELIRNISQEILDKHGPQYPYITQPIFFKPAPKGDGSVAFRVRQFIEMLQTERYFVDSGCVRTIDMLKHITSADKSGGSPFEPGKKSKYKHILDALTYPIVYHLVRGDSKKESERIKPQYY